MAAKTIKAAEITLPYTFQPFFLKIHFILMDSSQFKDADSKPDECLTKNLDDFCKTPKIQDGRQNW